MRKRYELKGGAGLVGVACVLFWACGPAVWSAGDGSPLPEFPEMYPEAADLERDFLEAEPGTRSGRMEALIRAFLAEGRLEELPQLFDEVAETEGEAGRSAAFLPDAFVILGDREAEYAARREARAVRGDSRASLERLAGLAETLGDRERESAYRRELADRYPDLESRMGYYRMLLDRNETEALVEAWQRHEETLFTVRGLFPELHRAGRMDAVEPLAADAAGSSDNDWRALFSLGEYAIYTGNPDGAAEAFAALWRMVDAGGADGQPQRSFFVRLNNTLFTRFTAMRHLALASGSMGPDAHVAFAFFGMPDAFEPDSLADARIAALLYERETALEAGRFGSFIKRRSGDVAASDAPFGERILAMAAAGAPRYLLREIAAYLDSGEYSVATDRFVLQAINRFVQSVEKFPELRDEKIRTAEAVAGRLMEEDDDTRRFVERLHGLILDRIGETDTSGREETRAAPYGGRPEREERTDPVRDRLSWTSSLLRSDRVADAAAILAELPVDELDFSQRRLFVNNLMIACRKSGEADRAAPFALKLLVHDAREDFDMPGSPLRREALHVLEDAGEMERYRETIEAALAFSPGSLLVSVLKVEEELFSSREGLEQVSDETAALLEKAVEQRGNVDFDGALAYWLQSRGRHDDAVVVYRRMLEEYPAEALVYFSYILEAYDETERLDELAGWFEGWKSPRVTHIDLFYGIQPSHSLFKALGEALYAGGEREAAVDLWQRAVKSNPVEFTPSTRVRLARELWERGEVEPYVDLLEDYLFRETEVPEFWLVHPFISVIPYWLAEDAPDQSALMEMLAVLEESDKVSLMVERARHWRDMTPGDLFRECFFLVVLAWAKHPEFNENWETFIKTRTPAGEGPDGQALAALMRWIHVLAADWDEASAARRQAEELLEEAVDGGG